MNRPTPDNDENDPIELWGTRIGRGLGFLITIGIILAVIVWLGAERP
jgi:tetrahydromethanopterin S-methyltransferase subunit G